MMISAMVYEKQQSKLVKLFKDVGRLTKSDQNR